MFKIFAKTKYYQRWIILIPLMFSGIWFYMLEKSITKPDFLLYNRLDDYIPFMSIFVVPYVFWYAYIIIPAIYFFYKAPCIFVKYTIFLTIGMAFACTIYTLFPNGQALRPMIGNHEEPLLYLIRFIYSKDTPANSAPSIHVIYSVAAHGAIAIYNNIRWKSIAINNISLIMALLCILSTVFIKQHSVIDMAAGLVLSGLLYLFIYKYKNILLLASKLRTAENLS